MSFDKVLLIGLQFKNETCRIVYPRNDTETLKSNSFLVPYLHTNKRLFVCLVGWLVVFIIIYTRKVFLITY